MKSILPRPRKVTLDVTDDRLTDSGGLTSERAASKLIDLALHEGTRK